MPWRLEEDDRDLEAEELDNLDDPEDLEESDDVEEDLEDPTTAPANGSSAGTPWGSGAGDSDGAP